MKSVVADYRYRVLCLRIVPVTGSPIYLTDHPRDLVMSGHTYLSTAGYQFTGYAGTAGFSPASVDIEGIAGASGLSRAAVGSGPLPPQVGKTTSYRVTWTVANTTSDAATLVVSARLPNSVLWTGKNPTRDAGDMSYDPVTRMVQWRRDTASSIVVMSRRDACHFSICSRNATLA